MSPSLLLAEPSTFLCVVANCLLSLGEYQNNDKQLTVTSWGGGGEQTKESSPFHSSMILVFVSLYFAKGVVRRGFKSLFQQVITIKQ